MRRTIILLFTVLLWQLPLMAALEPSRGPIRQQQTLDERPNTQNRVHRGGNVWMNITNMGCLGNGGPGQSEHTTDPCSQRWAPACEFPAGSGVQYMYQASLWIGAIIVDGATETPRVSVGTDGWLNPSINEFWPGEGDVNGIQERSNLPYATDCDGNNVYDPTCVANQEFTALYSDTLTSQTYLIDDPIDGSHRPLGLQVRQVSRGWSSTTFGDFIIFEFRVRNISARYLKNVYLGFYNDADVGDPHLFEQHTDDITGFRRCNAAGDTINIPYIADNDGRNPNGPFEEIYCPHVCGAYVLVPPAQRYRFSYNWWIPNGDTDVDFGPCWSSYADRDSMGLGWTRLFGTPMGDRHKYQLLSNGEIDFDQIMTDHLAQVPPQVFTDPFTGQTRTEPWCQNAASPQGADIANGFDTRYLMSWGPLGILDHYEPNGDPVFRLNPGEEFTLTMAIVLGSYFHDPNHPQPDPSHLDSSLFHFAGLEQTARRAKFLFDRNYNYQPPAPPDNLRPLAPLANMIPLVWTPPRVGTIQGYNVYGIPQFGTGQRVQWNSTLLHDTLFIVPGLGNGEDWKCQVETVDDSNFVSQTADTMVRVGAPLPVTGLTALANGTSISLHWNPSNDPALTEYRLLRRSRQGDSTAFTAITAAEYTDQTALAGQVYTYWIFARNARGLDSYRHDSVTVVAWAPQRRILLIDESETGSYNPFGRVPSDSIRSRYLQILNELGTAFDTVSVFDGNWSLLPFEALAQYDLIIWQRENPGINVDQEETISARETALREYVDAGGRLLRIGRRVLNTSVGLSGYYFPAYWDDHPFVLSQTLDSCLAMNRYAPLTSPPGMQLIGGQAMVPGFHDFTLDTARIHAMNFRNVHLDYLPEIDLFWPHAPVHPLFRSVVLPTDTSGFAHQPVAVIGAGAIYLEPPLYFMTYADARDILQACIDTLRTMIVNDVPPAPRPELPSAIRLYPNYPNPFNPTTTIRFDLDKTDLVELAIFNALGQKVAVLMHESCAAGSYTATWDGKNSASGVYLCRLKTGSGTAVQKMLLLR